MQEQEVGVSTKGCSLVIGVGVTTPAAAATLPDRVRVVLKGRRRGCLGCNFKQKLTSIPLPGDAWQPCDTNFRHINVKYLIIFDLLKVKEKARQNSVRIKAYCLHGKSVQYTGGSRCT